MTAPQHGIRHPACFTRAACRIAYLGGWVIAPAWQATHYDGYGEPITDDQPVTVALEFRCEVCKRHWTRLNKGGVVSYEDCKPN